MLWATDEFPDNPIAHLFDGRPSRPFQVQWQYDNAITVDLGESRPVDFLSIHGHNLSPDVVVELWASDIGLGEGHEGVLVATLTPRQPSF